MLQRSFPCKFGSRLSKLKLVDFSSFSFKGKSQSVNREMTVKCFNKISSMCIIKIERDDCFGTTIPAFGKTDLPIGGFFESNVIFAMFNYVVQSIFADEGNGQQLEILPIFELCGTNVDNTSMINPFSSDQGGSIFN